MSILLVLPSDMHFIKHLQRLNMFFLMENIPLAVSISERQRDRKIVTCVTCVELKYEIVFKCACLNS